MENNEQIINSAVQNNIGTIKISDEVVSVITGITATEVKGVAAMSGGVARGITEMLGRKNLSKGVKVEVGETEAAIDLYIVVEFDYPIPEIASNIQEKVKNSIENMTGLKVVEINVHVQGVHFPENDENSENKSVEVVNEEKEEPRVK